MRRSLVLAPAIAAAVLSSGVASGGTAYGVERDPHPWWFIPHVVPQAPAPVPMPTLRPSRPGPVPMPHVESEPFPGQLRPGSLPPPMTALPTTPRN